MISILIPTYNYNIVKLVTNLHGQCTEQPIDYEILVLDDYSSNKEIKNHNRIINNLDKCRYIESKENRGRTASREHLANEATYNWLLFLDADVMPKYEDFMNRFIENLNKAQLIFGGITYAETKPSADLMLRWKYGHSRESLTVLQRDKTPYLSINSGCFLIEKEPFVSVNKHLAFKSYGLDNLFKQLLEKREVSVLHIDNPVYHLGLEKNTVFIKKSLESVETTILLEKKGLIKSDLRPIQKTYLKSKKYGILPLFRKIITLFEKQLISNFNSKNPSLFLFDLYRLYYYDKLKRNA
ncbi:glycosyltransferase family 2 protein [Marixanthomonas ophiurae]|uniref:Glycosyltransferase family 2 protein n=1 Tax=Marixanthomonas ophiurae TaxID=387659 RepID=A0A3E1Q8U5_9FLAO|nr:glycosyltransferase [Marixanthomonas ophiurae]RFN58549.1 glycosyltransferase family 2 protein [Marixanthomonas ophiurae]